MITFAEQDIKQQGNYIKLLTAVSKLSGLFSDSTIPYINYRVAENVFCRSFGAENLSRSDTAFDAKIDKLGIGLKTFTCPSNYSNEKVAEFNSLSADLSQYKGKKLAYKLAEGRNERIRLACELYGIERGIYHIVARRDQELLLFETDYAPIDIDAIKIGKVTKASLSFTDGLNEYSFNYSKSTLYRKFYLPDTAYRFPIEILHDPYQILLELYDHIAPSEKTKERIGIDYVVLPLYSTASKEREVRKKSGLNQWNAGGRARDYGEVYIPVPRKVHQYCPDFFPSRDTPFRLSLPAGADFTAKLCQDNSKALMTNPNNALSDWLLRGLCKLEEGTLLTRQRLDLLGFDSVRISKKGDGHYAIDIMPLGSYEQFIEEVSFSNH